MIKKTKTNKKPLTISRLVGKGYISAYIFKSMIPVSEGRNLKAETMEETMGQVLLTDSPLMACSAWYLHRSNTSHKS